MDASTVLWILWMVIWTETSKTVSVMSRGPEAEPEDNKEVGIINDHTWKEHELLNCANHKCVQSIVVLGIRFIVLNSNLATSIVICLIWTNIIIFAYINRFFFFKTTYVSLWLWTLKTLSFLSSPQWTFHVSPESEFLKFLRNTTPTPTPENKLLLFFETLVLFISFFDNN